MKEEKQKYVSYCRVSSISQGISKLGLESQKETVLNYVSGHGILIAEFVEVETGTSKRNRIEIYKAIQLAQKEKAILVIAKLDRLSRNVHFISSLMESKIQFVCCDMPTANSFTLNIFSSLAQYEAEMISSRTKSALDALKKRGVALGKPENLTYEDRIKGARILHQNSLNHPCNIRAYAMAKVLKEQGKKLVQITKELNNNGYVTVKNSVFYPSTVRKLFLNYEENQKNILQ